MVKSNNVQTHLSTLKQLFQQEFSKMVAVISNLFGLQHIEIAEDIVSETFLAATENWAQKGIPENPAAWLYVVAKQKTLYHFRRNRIYEKKVIPELSLRQDNVTQPGEPDFSLSNISFCSSKVTSSVLASLRLDMPFIFRYKVSKYTFSWSNTYIVTP